VPATLIKALATLIKAFATLRKALATPRKEPSKSIKALVILFKATCLAFMLS
jgi:hypothetical protein